MIQDGDATVKSIIADTDAFDLYIKMTCNPDPHHKIIGKGEAASIVLAKENDGILASNNLRDVSQYVTEYNLKHVTTGEIMKNGTRERVSYRESGKYNLGGNAF